MSWPTQPKVSLRVTKFAPVSAGLTPEAREAHRARREAECKRVEPAYEVRKPYNVFMYGNFVQLERIEVDVPDLPEILAHPAFCPCERCLNAGVRYADYLKAKRNEF